MEVVDSRYGKLIASRSDVYLSRSLFEYGEFSEGEVEFFRQFITPESIVCDVGANIGAHSLAFSKMAKHVYAFEPVPLLYQALCGMIALNELRNVSAYNIGIGERETSMSYMDIEREEYNNWGGASLLPFDGTHEIQIVPLEVPCHFLKVDVEGMELEVLKGAEKMIQQCRPILYVEADRQDKFKALHAYIKHLGYYPYWHTPLLYNPKNIKGNPRDIWPGMGSLNLACFPMKIEEGKEAETWDFGQPHDWSLDGLENRRETGQRKFQV